MCIDQVSYVNPTVFEIQTNYFDLKKVMEENCLRNGHFHFKRAVEFHWRLKKWDKMNMGITVSSCNIYQDVRLAVYNRYYFAKIVILRSGLETVNDLQ